MKPVIRNRWARSIWGRYGIKHIQRFHGRKLYSNWPHSQRCWRRRMRDYQNGNPRALPRNPYPFG